MIEIKFLFYFCKENVWIMIKKSVPWLNWTLSMDCWSSSMWAGSLLVCFDFILNKILIWILYKFLCFFLCFLLIEGNILVYSNFTRLNYRDYQSFQYCHPLCYFFALTLITATWVCVISASFFCCLVFYRTYNKQ